MPAPENAFFHRHLVAAYALTWVLQLSYLAFVVVKRVGTSVRDK